MNELDSLHIENARKIYEASLNNDLVIFVGAGVSSNSGVLDWGELIKELKKSLPNSVAKENDYLKIAQLFKDTYPNSYLDSIQHILKDGKVHPNPIHKAILDLSPAHIITTNYDNLIELSIDNSRTHFSIIRSDQDVPRAKSARYLIKMHGDFVSKSIVLTESDYYNYTKNYPLIDNLIKSIFASKTILCVGFSFNDLNLKIILNTIQSILGKNAKPVYLLADYNDNPVLYNYLNNKGIQPLWIPANVVEQFGKDAPDSLKDDIGKNTFKQLSCLKYDVSKPLDIIDALYSYSQIVEGEMPFFYVSRLRKILPDKICKWDHTYSMGIQLESEHIQSLIEQCKSTEGKRRLLQEKGDKIHSLIKTAANNCIFEFGGIKLSQLKSFRRYWNSRSKDCCSFFLEFDFQALSSRMKELEFKECTYSNQDLELPFIKWMLGDVISSYELYESLGTRYWASNNAILYFLCAFNKQALFKGSFPIIVFPYEKLIALSEREKDLDMNEILSELLIDSRVKDNLSDLINNQYDIDTFQYVNELTNALLEDKYRSEHNGFSMNSHIAELSYKLMRSFDYSCVNYIITTNSISAYESFRNGIIGLLTAHKIKETKKKEAFFAASRLEYLESGHIKLMLFTIGAEDLKKAFDIYEINSILLDNEAVIYIQTVIDNILRDYQLIKKTLRYDIIINRLACLFVIYSKCSNELNKTSEMVDIVVTYNLLSNDLNQSLFQRVICDIICKDNYALSEKQCHSLLSFFPELNQSTGVPSILQMVSTQMRDMGWVADHTLDMNVLSNKPLWEVLNEMYLYYEIVSDVTRTQIEAYLRDIESPSGNDLLMICAIIVDKHAYGIVSPDLVERIKLIPDNHNRCRILKDIFVNVDNVHIKKEISEISKSDARLEFYISPTTFNGDIDVQWLKYIDDRSFRTLVKRDDIMQSIKDLGYDSDICKRYWKTL